MGFVMMKIGIISLVFSLLLSFSNTCTSFAQEAVGDSERVSHLQYGAVFEDVQVGISTGNIGLLAKHFAPQIQVNLRGDESGTFSSNQTYYVVQNFFKTRRIGGFEFSTFAESDASPYGTGEAELTDRGSRERVQIYVALSLLGKRYLITQLTIY